MHLVWRLARRVTFVILSLPLSVLWQEAAEAAQFTLAWTDQSSNETGFKLERRTGTSGSFAPIATLAANTTLYTDSSGLAAASTYCYRLYAFNQSEISAYSNELCGTAPAGATSLTVTKGGNGSGTVTSSPAGVSCGSDCSETYPSGASVTLTATQAAGSTFTGWSGACSGTGTCTVTLTGSTSVTATFALQTITLTVAKAGAGSGTISSSPTGITCGADCSETYTSGTAVTLTAAPAAGSVFTGWSGGGCGATSACTVTLSASSTVTATFMSNAAKPQALFLEQDATTKGDWQDLYGSEGFILINHKGGGQDSVSLPPHLGSYSHTGSTYVWSNPTTDPRALADLTGKRVAATAYSNTSFSLTLTAKDLTPHVVSLYFVDWDSTQRAQTVTVYDAATNAVLDQRPLSKFNGGIYYTYKVQGSVRVQLTRTGAHNAVLSGVFWDDVEGNQPQALFLEQDATTKGDWQDLYGSEGFILINHKGGGQDSVSLPPHLGSYSHTGSTYVWSNPTTDPRALADLTGKRVAATAYSNTSFSLTLTAKDLTPHVVSLYFVDWDSTQRAQTVTVYDAATNAVLDQRPLSKFNGGIYYTYKVQGSVRVQLTRTGAHNAVLSGVFWGE